MYYNVHSINTHAVANTFLILYVMHENVIVLLDSSALKVNKLEMDEDIATTRQNGRQVSAETVYQQDLTTGCHVEALLGKVLQDKQAGLRDICLILGTSNEVLRGLTCARVYSEFFAEHRNNFS